jgi:excisionase family DNA binding protein
MDWRSLLAPEVMMGLLGRLSDHLWMTGMTTATAADRLGVSQRQVERLIASGDLPASRTAGDAWVVDALALHALARTRPARGRPWSAGTAWAALWHLSGLEAEWLDRRSARRLVERLGSLDADSLVHACRRRAATRHYRVSDSYIGDLRAAVVRSGTSATSAGTLGIGADAARVDGYCDEGAVAQLEARFHLLEDIRGNATLRVAPLGRLRIGDRQEVPVAVVAADLAESIEVRERSAGLRVLESLLR